MEHCNYCGSENTHETDAWTTICLDCGKEFCPWIKPKFRQIWMNKDDISEIWKKKVGGNLDSCGGTR
ncbi:MAG: hypothetical protein PHE59_04390 [Patescibacteria group bacterium]|nr:hypothetical protein [Patescibacteria group bacterium]MDD5535007.1 hypothetical protein [Patescibacteria group bacterium]